MISKKDSKPFLVKFAKYVQRTTKQQTIYKDDWQTLYALISDPKGAKVRHIYGTELDFDKLLTLNAGSVSRKIKENTVFLVDNYPTDTFKNGDYTVKYLFPEYNGEINIGLVKKSGIDIPPLYFYSNGELVYFQLNFDSETNTGYIGSNIDIPVFIGDYVWTKKPNNNDPTQNRLVLESIQKTGLDTQWKNFTKLTFVEG